jgi:mutator protein MutT
MHPYLCSSEFRALLARHLSNFQSIQHATENLRHAAVALTIVDSSQAANVPGLAHQPSVLDRAALILTRRAAKLNSHGGQWAFPGGSVDAGETVEEAALRELHEEVGLELGQESILGRLDDFTTRSGFVMSPVVIWGGCDLALQPDPREVASIHRIPVEELMRPDAPSPRRFADLDEPILVMPIGLRYIAPPTGAMLYQFREVAVLGRKTRVSHFEQPRFAWK